MYCLWVTCAMPQPSDSKSAPSNPKKSSVDKAIIPIEPGTLMLIISLLILVPLIVTGFVSQ